MTDDIDDGSARAISALQLQEVEELKLSFAGEEETDQTIALQTYQDDLERRATTLRDHYLATLFGEMPLHDDRLPEAPPATTATLPIDTVEGSDSPDYSITEIEDNEQPDDKQRDDTQQIEIQQDSIQTDELKLETSDEVGIGPPAGPNMLGRVRHTHSESHTADPSPIARASMFLLSPFRSQQWNHTSNIDEESQLHNITSDLKAAQSHGPSENEMVLTSKPAGPCIICGDELPSETMSQLSCGDWYCHECLVDLFNGAMKDESLFPPRCCEKIPLSAVQHLLPPDFPEKFQARVVELDTPNRTYCVNSDCSKFINPGDIEGDVATCSNCWVQTCVICKRYAHQGDCPEDPAVVGLMALAAREGFRQCPSCQLMVELELGCNHITWVSISHHGGVVNFANAFKMSLPSRILLRVRYTLEGL
ncbi:MAG: hypothetical protein Q9213_000796 [Squamulea squamosa]